MVSALRTASGRRQAGFTLLEAMTVVGLMAIVATLAVPSLREIVLTARVRGAASELQATLVRARSEAIKRNAPVDVVPQGGAWVDGWQLRVGTTTLERHAQLDSLAATSTAPATITFRVDGRLAAGQQTIVFSAVDATGVKPRCVALDASGRAVVHIDSDTDSSNGCN